MESYGRLAAMELAPDGIRVNAIAPGATATPIFWSGSPGSDRGKTLSQEDNDVRQGIKKYSDWPTFPQFYVDSKLIGGLDILVDMAEDAEESLAAELGL